METETVLGSSLEMEALLAESVIETPVELLHAEIVAAPTPTIQIPIVELAIEPVASVPIETAPFTITSLLSQLRTIPDLSILPEAPFAEGGTWLIDAHTKAKWLSISFVPGKHLIQVEHYMDHNPISGGWTLLGNKPIDHSSVDGAILAIKAILEG